MTRQRIVEATLRSLRSEGFAGTSARTIARHGAFNAPLIFYHFNGLNDLLLAALEAASANRLNRYREAIGETRALSQLLQIMSELFETDMESPELAAVREMVANGGFSAELGPAIVDRMQPWYDFAEEVVRRVLDGSPLADAVPAPQIASAVIALYVGVETITRLEGQSSRAASMLEAASRLALLLDAGRADTMPEPRTPGPGAG